MSEKFNNNVEADDQFRSEQSEKVAEFLDRSDAYGYFQDMLSGKEEIPDFDKFKDFIVRINGIARDIPISERNLDGVNVGLSGFMEDVIVPKHEDKEELLRYAYDAVPRVAKEDVKYMLPAVINAVHLFNDANGRTSRIMHLLLGGYSSEEEFLQEAKRALGKDGRFDSLDINPGLIGFELEQEVLKKHGWIFNEENPEGRLGSIKEGLGYDVRKFDLTDDLLKAAKRFFELCKENGHYAATSIYMLLGNEGIKPLFQEYGIGDIKRTAVSQRRMVEVLKTEDWKKIIDNFYQLKKEQVEVLVDIFRSPDEYKTRRGDKIETIKDVFIGDINKRGNFI